MQISCPDLKTDNFLPHKYTCQGEGFNPPLKISQIPEETKSLALIVDDPDAPSGTFTHWLVWNIHPVLNEIEQNSIPLDAVEGVNSGDQKGYYPPCPPNGIHRYRFKLYALDQYLSIPADSSQTDFETSIQDHVVAQAKLITRYQKT